MPFTIPGSAGRDPKIKWPVSKDELVSKMAAYFKLPKGITSGFLTSSLKFGESPRLIDKVSSEFGINSSDLEKDTGTSDKNL